MPKQFETLRSRVANVLGGLALTIEHVGSTAIPGLAAKPIIDIDALLRSPDDLPPVIAALASVESILRKSVKEKAISKLAVSSVNADA